MAGMEGRIVFVNHKREMAALLTDGGYTVFELLGSEVDAGDVITGDLESLGRETWQNATKKEKIDVAVEDIHCSRAIAIRFIS